LTDASVRAPPEYRGAAEAARRRFAAKAAGYGPSWLLLRPQALTDMVLIKAYRVRTLLAQGRPNLAGEAVEEDLLALVNYAAMAVHQARANPSGRWPSLPEATDELVASVDAVRAEAEQLLIRKNHDYGEAWRDFRMETFVDIILTKIHRVRSLEGTCGAAYPTEPVVAEWLDVYNYGCLFAGQWAKK
jgi:Nucleotide modification associated domain 1